MRIDLILFFILFSFIISCDGFHEEMVPINIDVEDVETILVINGKIEEGQIAWVQISYSEDINASANTPINYEKNATVSISTNSGSSEEMLHIWDGIYIGSKIKGIVDETYTMTVTIGSKTYTANSTMLKPRGYQGAWVYQLASNDNGKDSSGKEGSSKYSDEWIINDPSATRNRYLFEWWVNGVHYIRQDWAIDDNRVVNANEGLKLFTVTLDPLPNQYIQHRTAEIDKVTYDSVSYTHLTLPTKRIV